MRLLDQLRLIVEANKERFDDPIVAEATGIGDFANILGSQMNRTLFDAYKDVQTYWRNYTRTALVTDFRTSDRIAGSDAEDLLDLGPGGTGPYQDSKLTEQKYSIRAKTKGRAFSVTRHAIINDDLNFLRDQPRRFGRSAARTLTKDVVAALEANLAAYDGVALFHTSHSNVLTGGGSGLTSANLNTARLAISRARFEGEFMGLRAATLLIPPELENTARILLESEMLPQPGTGVGNLNPDRNTLNLVVDPWLTSATAWYVMAPSADVPTIEVAFLDGKDTPDLLVEMPQYRLVAGGGGEDEWMHGEFDQLRYAVRFDYGISVGMYQGAYKGAGV